jgi:hypothetical protein
MGSLQRELRPLAKAFRLLKIIITVERLGDW